MIAEWMAEWLPEVRADQRRVVPEVVQTSSMDCGPAALKSVLAGFDIQVNYGRLRELCQTGLDGTAIETLEQVGQQLGLDAQQIMLPADHLLLNESDALPAIAVIELPNGTTHFIVIWSIHGSFVQVMDPSAGRQWLSKKQLLNDLHRHAHTIEKDAWREWATTHGFQMPLRARLQALWVEQSAADQWLADAAADASWLGYGLLDATVRFVTDLHQSEAILQGAEAQALINNLLAKARESAEMEAVFDWVPRGYWFVTPDEDAPDQLTMRGAVLVAVDGKHAPDAVFDASESPPPLDDELLARVTTPEPTPFWEIWRLLRDDGFLAPSIVLLATIMASLGVTMESYVLRGLLESADTLLNVSQRANTLWLIVGFGIIMLVLEYALSDSLLRMGRHLDARLRIAFLSKIPQLNDRYFQSRLVSDMTMRAHELSTVQSLPTLAVRFLRYSIQLVLTAIGVVAYVPEMLPIVLIVLLMATLPPLIAQPVLQEQDLRYRSHSGGLSRFYLDGLLGLMPIRTHSAETSLRHAHQMMLTEWYRSGQRMYNTALGMSGVQQLLTTVGVVLILVRYLSQGGATTGILLLFYWTLNLPVLGQQLTTLILQYPQIRNSVQRILEPLGAANEIVDMPRQSAETPIAERNGVAIEMQNVEVVASGRSILSEINASIAAGEHVAVVGSSGAGKSSLVGLLLGWHRPKRGTLTIDGVPASGVRLANLRQKTAWVDPTVYLWNRNLLDNLKYGNDDTTAPTDAFEAANLYDVLRTLPDGMQTPLGEGGRLIAGGQGQRVRFARSLLRKDVQLAILDEPFRGLDRTQRRQMLANAREAWQDATLLFVTHDVGDTHDFDRVLVIEDGMIIEDAAPQQLAAQADSRYRALLDAEQMVRSGLWESSVWRRLHLEKQSLREET